MGNRNHVQQQLQFYTTIPYKNYGPCSVYTSNKFPQSFIIKIIYRFTNSNNHTQLMDLYSQIQNLQNLYLIGMYGYKLGKNCDCPSLRGLNNKSNLTIQSSSGDEEQERNQKFLENCEKIVSSHFLTAYWEYLSFSLKDILRQRRQILAPFHEQEIWHILKACAHGYSAFSRNCMSFQFKPSNILVNMDGRVRLDWMEIEPKNTHTALYKKLNRNSIYTTSESESSSQASMSCQLGDGEFMSPEQLVLLRQKQLTNKINYQKTNIFALGMTILECMTLRDPLLFYDIKACTLNYERLIMTLRMQERYTYELSSLIKSMLSWEPQYRPDFQYIRQKYQSVMRPDFCIKITRENTHISKFTIREEEKEEYRKISIKKFRKSEAQINNSPMMKESQQHPFKQFKGYGNFRSSSKFRNYE